VNDEGFEKNDMFKMVEKKNSLKKLENLSEKKTIGKKA